MRPLRKLHLLLGCAGGCADACDRRRRGPDLGERRGRDGAVRGRPHGERAVVMGYPEAGLEVWAWPLQILSGYQVRFREPDRVAPIDGRAVLSRIEYRPTEIVRAYAGPDFVVRERLFAYGRGRAWLNGWISSQS